MVEIYYAALKIMVIYYVRIERCGVLIQVYTFIAVNKILIVDN